MEFKKSLGYFHHKEQNILHQVSRSIVALLPNSVVYLISSEIQHHLIRNIYTKPQRIELWKYKFDLFILLTDTTLFNNFAKEQLNGIHSEITMINVISQNFNDFLHLLESNDINSHWILNKSPMVYGCDHMISQLPAKKKFSQAEEELIWFQHLSM